MEKMKEFFNSKGYGFYVVLLTMLLTIFAIIAFFVGNKEGYVSWGSFAFMLVLVLGDILLIAFKQDNYVPALNFVCSLFACGFFINACYSYIATVMTGIDIETFSIGFILSVIGNVCMIVFSIASIFMPLKKQQLN